MPLPPLPPPHHNPQQAYHLPQHKYINDDDQTGSWPARQRIDTSCAAANVLSWLVAIALYATTERVNISSQEHSQLLRKPISNQLRRQNTTIRTHHGPADITSNKQCHHAVCQHESRETCFANTERRTKTPQLQSHVLRIVMPWFHSTINQHRNTFEDGEAMNYQSERKHNNQPTIEL